MQQFLLDKTTVLYNPALDPTHVSGVSSQIPVEARTAPVRFSRPIERKGRKNPNTIEAPEIAGIFIVPGINSIPEVEWEWIQKHPLGSQYCKSGAFRQISPTFAEGQAATGLSMDFAEADALEIVRNMHDIDWLERSDRKEDSQRMAVSNAIAARLKELKKQSRPARVGGSIYAAL